MMKTLSVLLVATALPAYASSKTVTLSVPDMNCAACPITIKKVLSKIDGVTAIEVSAKTREAVVSFDDAKTNVRALTEATTNVGYASTVKTSQP